MIPLALGARGAAAERPDLLFLDDLKRALQQPGCPLCRLVREADRRYVAVFLREGKDDGRVILRLLDSWGLCAQHADDLARFERLEEGDGLGTGTLYNWLLDQARRLLDDVRREVDGADRPRFYAWRRRRRSGRRLQSGCRRMAQREPCPACAAREWQAGYIAERFVRALEPAVDLPEFPALYRVSPGLCLPHWRAIRACRPSAAVDALVADKQQRVRAALRSALDTVFAERDPAGVGVGEASPEAVCARALAWVAGDMTWRPSAAPAPPAP